MDASGNRRKGSRGSTKWWDGHGVSVKAWINASLDGCVLLIGSASLKQLRFGTPSVGCAAPNGPSSLSPPAYFIITLV